MPKWSNDPQDVNDDPLCERLHGDDAEPEAEMCSACSCFDDCDKKDDSEPGASSEEIDHYEHMQERRIERDNNKY